MPSKVIPMELQALINDKDTVAAWISDNHAPNACENCGGIGFIYVFIGVAGPFKSPPGGICKSDGERWWKGETFGSPCPVCTKGKI